MGRGLYSGYYGTRLLIHDGSGLQVMLIGNSTFTMNSSPLPSSLTCRLNPDAAVLRNVSMYMYMMAMIKILINTNGYLLSKYPHVQVSSTSFPFSYFFSLKNE